MRCGLVLPVVLTAVACCLSSTPLFAEQSASESPACLAIVKDLKGQIETIKVLKAHPDTGFRTFEIPIDSKSKAKKRTQAEDPRKILSRDREQAEALNAMLPGLGCSRLDIDYELKQPINEALIPPAPKGTKKHHLQ